MNDQDLFDQLTASTEWTRQTPVDPRADVARGRSRLRLRRVRTGAALLSTVAVAAIGLDTVGRFAAPEPQPGVATTSPDAGPPRSSGPVGTTADPLPDLKRESALRAQGFAALVRHVDPGRTHLRTKPHGATSLYDRSGEELYTAGFDVRWYQGTGTGIAEVKVWLPGRFDTVTGTGARSDQCGMTNHPFQYTSCRWTETATGRRVLVGTVSGDRVKGYFASHLNADGYLVTARVDGDRTRRDPVVGRPDSPPVQDPDVDLAALVATVTDPAVTAP